MSEAHLQFSGFVPGELTFEASHLFTFASQIKSAALNPFPPLSAAMMPLGVALCERVGVEPRFTRTEKSWLSRYKPVPKTNRAMVGFSGGKDSAAGMGSMVMKLLQNGETDENICNNLGLEPDELLRLKHVTGFSKLFENARYNKAWTTPEQIKEQRKYDESQNPKTPA